jgi:hypothetical protein
MTFSHKVLYSVIQGKVEEIELPVKEVDVIVSEWMVSVKVTFRDDRVN